MDYDDIMMRIIPAILVLSLLGILIGLPIACYKSACVKASIYNGINDTEYTCSDFLWGSEQINAQTQTIKIK